MTVRGSLKEAQDDLSALRQYRQRLLSAGNSMNNKVLLDFEAEARKAMAEAEARVKELQSRIAWSIHRQSK